MDYFNTIGYWEKKVHGIDNINGCCILWTIISLSGQVRVHVAI